MLEKLNSFVKLNDCSIEDIENITSSNDELEREYNEFIEKCYQELKSGRSLESILNSLKNENIESILIEKFSSDFETYCKPYNETEFIRNNNLSDNKKLMELLLNNTLIYKEPVYRLLEKTKLEETELRHAIKFLNTINIFIIKRRYTKEMFKEYAEDYFGIKEDLIEYLWSLFVKHKAELVEAYLIDRTNRIDRSINEINNIFTALISDDEEINKL